MNMRDKLELKYMFNKSREYRPSKLNCGEVLYLASWRIL